MVSGLGDDGVAVVAALRSQVDDPVGGGDDVEVVLDDDHRVARRDEPVEDAEQAVDVGRPSLRRSALEEQEPRMALIDRCGVALAVQPAVEGLGQLVEPPASGTGVNDPRDWGQGAL